MYRDTVIHFTPVASITDELPHILTGKAPLNPSSTIGSGNWSSSPRALVLGGTYTDELVDKILELVKNVPGAADIPWIRLENKVSGELTEEQAAAYGKQVVRRVKQGLDKLEKERKLAQDNKGIYLV